MKIHNVQQGSDEWVKLRLGRVTASELDNIVTPEFKLRTGEMYKTYLYTKLGEAFTGTPQPGFSSWATEQGQEREDEAWYWYSLTYDAPLRKVGFVEADNSFFGCSPDGLIGDDNGLELKAPERVNHIRYLTEGILPKAYAAQVHGSLYATNRSQWTFMSYRRGFPAFVLEVKRDEDICRKIDTAIETFRADFDMALARLKSLAPKKKPHVLTFGWCPNLNVPQGGVRGTTRGNGVDRSEGGAA